MRNITTYDHWIHVHRRIKITLTHNVPPSLCGFVDNTSSTVLVASINNDFTGHCHNRSISLIIIIKQIMKWASHFLVSLACKRIWASIRTSIRHSYHNFTHIAAIISLFTRIIRQSYHTSHLYDLMIDRWICVRLRLRVERETTPSYVSCGEMNSIIIIVIIIPYMTVYGYHKINYYVDKHRWASNNV